MFDVDNSGKGNCMYYAYSISLMYYLRAKNAPDTTENIFNKLKLKEDDKVLLRALVSKNPNYQFTSREIKTIIEPILGKATRDLAAEYTLREFKLSPHDSPLFTSAKYGLEFCFRQALRENGSELYELIDHGFTNPDYTAAEIYKMSGTDLAMTEHAIGRVPHVIEEFKRLWAIKEEELKKEEKPFTEKEIKVYKEKLLDHILRDETVHFFLSDNEKYLNLYKEHLQKEYVWGSEETLLVLHRALQGERMVRNEKGTIDTFYDTEFVLHIHRNGSSPFFQSRSPDMILNNQSDIHWTSTIPDSIFTTKLTANETKLFELLDELRMMHSKIALEKDKMEHDLLSTLMKEMDLIYANPSYAMKEKAIESVFQLAGKLIMKLGSDSSWRLLLGNFLSAFIECTPKFLADKPMSLESKELSSEDSSGKELISKQVQMSSLSKFSHHTLFKKSEESLQKTYPQEIARYISEGKQSGPKVAKALRQIYQEGLDGNKIYTPEKCVEIALQYLSYVKHKKRHFILADVHNFVKEMDKIIKQKGDDLNRDLAHLDAIDKNAVGNASMSLM
ncbi:hypothetical protein [Legionella resiliens]|uniref:Dot/Icm T4SS effector n=1 Tax=Legionella resiliens TaxID=2905958 RepID=A0ABS8X453_9GAMM|nr:MULTISPECIES: hypothetical protein [unclassified Legionella]MCE0724393.1 hypothetical protein [Legionella sp. 9fVS26]MCE3533545.1 hypothetical protein [Legionella sp. 8cVS16]